MQLHYPVVLFAALWLSVLVIYYLPIWERQDRLDNLDNLGNLDILDNLVNLDNLDNRGNLGNLGKTEEVRSPELPSGESIESVDLLPTVSVTGPAPLHRVPLRPLYPCSGVNPGERKMVSITRVEGGFGDRIKGMVNAYILSLLSGRGFYFDRRLWMDSANTIEPGVCLWNNVTNINGPGKCTWDLRVVNVRDVIFSEIDFRSHDACETWNVLSNMPFGDEAINNPQFESSPLRNELSRSHREGKLFHQSLRSLITPSPSMERTLRTEMASRDPNSTYFLIGIHIRAGDGKIWTNQRKRDGYRSTHSHDFRMMPDAASDCVVQEAIVAWDELSQEKRLRFPSGPLFFVSGDYTKGAGAIKLKLLEKGFPAFDSSHLAGRVRHTVDGGDQSRTQTDWWFLTLSRKMVITVSGYSETASKYNCVPVSFFVNHPTLKHHNDFGPDKCVHHFIRMRGDGLCVPEADDNPLYEYTFDRYL